MGLEEFSIKYKWMPRRAFLDKFGIEVYDINNFMNKPFVMETFEPWRISMDTYPEMLAIILREGWEYYLTIQKEIRFTEEDATGWIHHLIKLNSVGRNDAFSFLVLTRYLSKIFGQKLEDFLSKGYTLTAFGAFEFYPGREF